MLSAAKNSALLLARRARLEKMRMLHNALRVPKEFANARDFLEVLSVWAAQHFGATRILADAASTDKGTICKWLSGRRMPPQAKLDKLSAWWISRERSGPLATTPAKSETPEGMSLRKLPPDLTARLKRTATLRNVAPMDYLMQILDRALPPLKN